MSDNEKLSRACAIAFEASGFLITPEQVRHLLLVPCNKRERLTSRLAEELSSRREAFVQAMPPLESLLSEFLRPEACRSVKSDLSSLLLSRLKGIRLLDVKTEVLMSWLAEIETSDSSSVQDGESVGEVTTPSRTETVAPDTQPVMQPCTHTRTDGEGV